MSKIFYTLRQYFNPAQVLPSGIYHYISPPDDPRNYRLHLRIEPDGNGLLIVNASSVLFLNQTAAEYAYYLIMNLPPDQVARKMTGRYHVQKEQAQLDYQRLVDRIQTIINTPDLDPETFLDFDRRTPFSSHLSAPYRLDCAITYQTVNPVEHLSAPVERVTKELPTDSWRSIIDKAWNSGIPHIVFTGGEPNLRSDLPELIAHAESNNMVTGLITSGYRLDDQEYLASLLRQGLDHMMIVFDRTRPIKWKVLENAIAADIFVAVHITIDQESQEVSKLLINELDQVGVHAISLSTADPALKEAVIRTRNYVASKGLELVWNLPVPYAELNPIAFEIPEQEYLQGAGKAWLYIEPDGDVLPAQGVNRILGNILNDPWDTIWKNR